MAGPTRSSHRSVMAGLTCSSHRSVMAGRGVRHHLHRLRAGHDGCGRTRRLDHRHGRRVPHVLQQRALRDVHDHRLRDRGGECLALVQRRGGGEGVLVLQLLVHRGEVVGSAVERERRVDSKGALASSELLELSPRSVESTCATGKLVVGEGSIMMSVGCTGARNKGSVKRIRVTSASSSASSGFFWHMDRKPPNPKGRREKEQKRTNTATKNSAYWTVRKGVE